MLTKKTHISKTPEKVIQTQEKEKKKCLAVGMCFTPLWS
jgi:hypothetical protein